MNLLFGLKYHLNRTARQAKFWKPVHYEAIPHYVKPHFIDIHDTYTPRSYQEVYNELSSKSFQVDIERVIYKQTDIRQDLKNRKCVLVANMAQF